MSDNRTGQNHPDDDFLNQIDLSHNYDPEDDFLGEVSESLKQQINEEFTSGEGDINSTNDNGGNNMGKKKKHLGLKITGGVILALLLCAAFILFTKPGHKIIGQIGGNYLGSLVDNSEADTNNAGDLFTGEQPINPDTGEVSPYRSESYVANFLIMGVEEIGGGGRTDSMMIVSVNTKDSTIKLTSLMRDCYVTIPGHSNNKLNAAYSFGGADLLIDTIQENFKIKIDGYAAVNFDSFEQVINLLGGVDIELGSAEANYLNTTNYISNPSYRNVRAGWNTLNGNQALGYSRVRKVATLGGANNDFGRTLRQRRVLNAIFDKYKSKSLPDMFSIMTQILPLIKTNLSSDKISQVLTAIIDHGIMTIDNHRIPAEGMYEGGKNECGSVLLLDFDQNIQELYRIIFLDEEESEEATVTPDALQDITVTP